MANVIPDLKVPAHYPLATDKVCLAGEGVAVVVATDPYIAADAVALIEVDYEPLPAVVDPEVALRANAPIIHEEFGTNVAFRFHLGEVDDSFGGADVVVRQRLESQRLIHLSSLKLSAGTKLRNGRTSREWPISAPLAACALDQLVWWQTSVFAPTGEQRLGLSDRSTGPWCRVTWNGPMGTPAPVANPVQRTVIFHA